ncbi:MAG: type II secretion system protein [Oscillospiraceae bacterium]
MYYFKKIKNKFGFTLTEIIVVMAILSIVLVVLTPRVGEYIESSKKTVVIANARTFHVACIAAISDIKSSANQIPLTNQNITLYINKSVLDKEAVGEGHYAIHDNEIISSFIRKDGYVAVYLGEVYIDNKFNTYMPPKPIVNVNNQTIAVEWIKAI